jgi:hypothetical protein
MHGRGVLAAVTAGLYHRREKSVLGFIYDNNNMDIPRSRDLGGRDRQ